MKNNLCSIIITGLPGSGKSYASKKLLDLGWHIISAGDTIREMCAKAGLDDSRQTLQLYGKELLKNKGEPYFASILMEQAKKHKNIIFEGIRPLGVIEIIRQQINCLVIYIDVDSDIRFERLKIRDGISSVSFENLESSLLEKQVADMKTKADIVVTNNTSFIKFEETIKNIAVIAINKCNK